MSQVGGTRPGAGRKPLGVRRPHWDKGWMRDRLHLPRERIAEECGCSAHTIYLWQKRFGLLKPLPPLPEKVDVDQIAPLYERGYSLRALARACPLSHETVRQRVLDAGIELRKRGK